MKTIRLRITDLLEEHGDTFQKCKGCATCEEIKTLRKQLERDPAEKFKHILAKGQDMTRSEIEFLIENEVNRKKIMKALEMQNNQFYEMMQNLKLDKRSEMEMAKLTLEEYQDLQAQGKIDKQIAADKGLNHHYLSQLKKKWGIRPMLSRTAEKQPSEGVSAKEGKEAEYQLVIKHLATKLESKEITIQEKDKLIQSLELKVAEYENLSAACDDVESEISSLREEKEKLLKEKYHNDYILENQKYQLGQYAKQNEELQEENAALKVFARRYLA